LYLFRDKRSLWLGSRLVVEAFYIDTPFHGLKDVGESFQLIGLIHNPHYVNNTRIFPVPSWAKNAMTRSPVARAHS
jgi:hypothetical protein